MALKHTTFPFVGCATMTGAPSTVAAMEPPTGTLSRAITLAVPEPDQFQGRMSFLADLRAKQEELAELLYTDADTPTGSLVAAPAAV